MSQCSPVNDNKQIFNFAVASMYQVFNENISMINANIKYRIKNSIREAMFNSPETFGYLETNVTHKLTK